MMLSYLLIYSQPFGSMDWVLYFSWVWLSTDSPSLCPSWVWFRNSQGMSKLNTPTATNQWIPETEKNLDPLFRVKTWIHVHCRKSSISMHHPYPAQLQCVSPHHDAATGFDSWPASYSPGSRRVTRLKNWSEATWVCLKTGYPKSHA